MYEGIKRPKDITGEILLILQLIVILGSENDWKKFVQNSKMRKKLDDLGIKYTVVVLSAHRNLKELISFCENAVEKNPKIIFMGIAGMSAALPGIIRAITERPTIGVALPSELFPDGKDAEISITRLPPGVVVSFAGTGELGLINAALLARDLIRNINNKVSEVEIKHQKQPKVLYLLGEMKEETK